MKPSNSRVSIAIAAVDAASKAGPGLPDANPRRRFEKLAAAADLEPASLRGFLKLLDKAGKAESEREFRGGAGAAHSVAPRLSADVRLAGLTR